MQCHPENILRIAIGLATEQLHMDGMERISVNPKPFVDWHFLGWKVGRSILTEYLFASIYVYI
jgi:hypothetical protein